MARSFRVALTWLAAVAASGFLAAPGARGACGSSEETPLRSVAFFYGDPVPVDRLAGFDAVVVEPDASFDPIAHMSAGPAWYAYVSVGEVTADRSYYRSIPKSWLVGRNTTWHAAVIDQSAPGWPAFFVDRIVAPLWARGYRGFFLDTLDSYELIAKTDEQRAKQRAGIVAAVRAVKARYPGARLIVNRGFDVLPEIHGVVSAVAFESLYGAWDQRNLRYGEVSKSDREWLLGKAELIRARYRLPVISIDYCAPADDRCRRQIARRVCDLGIVPYVTDGGLQTVGMGPADR